MSGNANAPRRSAFTAAMECVAAVAVVSAGVAVLERVVPVSGLAVVYLLAVLAVAIRRGEVSALATAVLSVFALNFFFIEPRYRLTIAHREDVVVLGVFIVVAVVVGRLAATGRRRAIEAEGLRAALQAGNGDSPRVRVGDLVVDKAAREVTRSGREIPLTPIEFDLVRVLADHEGELVTHRQLLKEVWGPAYTTETHYLRVHIAHIRAKLEPEPSDPHYLITRPGVGYLLREPSASEASTP